MYIRFETRVSNFSFSET